MDQSEITELTSVLEEFFNSAPGRRKDVSVEFEAGTGNRKGEAYINTEVGKEDELDVLQENGFIIYTIGGSRPSRYEDTKVCLEMKVPDPIPETITH